MKKLSVIVLVMFQYVANCQTRTVIISAPEPPGVPIDGGVITLLFAGGAIALKQKMNFFNQP